MGKGFTALCIDAYFFFFLPLLKLTNFWLLLHYNELKLRNQIVRYNENSGVQSVRCSM